MNWINPLIEEYYKWIKSKTSFTPDAHTGWVAISTPFIGLFNDALEIYAQKRGNKIVLSDNGETFHNLELVGAKIRKGERKEITDRILLNYGISIKDDELTTETSEKNFPQKKHNFLCAVMELNDLYMLSKSKVVSIFKEEVRAFLDENEIIYTPDFISKGSTGLEFTFDFQIAYKDKEIVVKSFNTINKLHFTGFLFAWEDIKILREKVTKKEVKAVAIINDREREIKEEYYDALRSKNAEFIKSTQWSEPGSLEKLRPAA